MKSEKILEIVLSGSRNVSFNDFVKLLNDFGFILDRISGSHHIFKHSNVKELLNIQNVGGKVKPYQMKQFLTLIENYNLKMEK